jgi:uncharacterized protein Yka (UPF0111/DUF47 family)
MWWLVFVLVLILFFSYRTREGLEEDDPNVRSLLQTNQRTFDELRKTLDDLTPLKEKVDSMKSRLDQMNTKVDDLLKTCVECTTK